MASHKNNANSRAATMQRWEDAAARLLVGRKVVVARYMNDEESQHMDWHQSGLVLQLDNDALLILMSDDEGNAPGAMVVSPANEKDPQVTLPRL